MQWLWSVTLTTRTWRTIAADIGSSRIVGAPGYGDNGYFYVPYGNLENHGDVSAITGAVSFTGPMYRTGVWGRRNGTQYNGS